VAKARRFIDESGGEGEVLVADNGSTDCSQALAQRAGARVVAVPEPGYGAALMGGIRAARGRYVAMGDADDSYDFSSLQPFLDRLRAGDTLVMGNRFKGGIEAGAMPPLHRYLGNPVLSFLGRLFFRVPIGDFHCGLRAFDRAAVMRLGLVSSGMEFASEMVVKAQLAGLRISEAPTTLSPDGRTRPPHLKTWRDGWRHLRFLLLHSPEWLFLYPGLLLLCAGVVGVVALFPGPIRLAGGLGLDTHTMLVAGFAVVAGSQLVSFSLMARRYAEHEGFLPRTGYGGALTRWFGLERLLLIALALLLVGGVGCGWAFLAWANHGFGAITRSTILRVMIPSLTALVVALQLGASAFFASVFSTRVGGERAGPGL
jgi:hypothetical protein